MASNKQFLQLVAMVPVAVLAIGCYYAWGQQYITHSDGEILVVTANDLATPSATAFSDQIWTGAQQARNDLTSESRSPGVRRIALDVDSSAGGTSPSHLTLQLAQQITRTKILGIISGGTSLTDEPLVKLCQRLRIPLLLGVATNDALTREKSDEQRVTFRMLPNNSRQAASISTKALDLSKPTQADPRPGVLIIHEDNAYGEFLYRKINASLTRTRTVFSFLTNDTNSIPVIMPSLEKLKSRTTVILYLGYAQRAFDLLQGLSGFAMKVPVILSDGCFSADPEPDLRSYSSRLDFSVFLSFSVQPWKDRDRLFGYQRYGYNAYILLARLDDAMQRTDPHSLRDALNNVRLPQPFMTNHSHEFNQYEFRPDGEPNQPDFMMIPVSMATP